MGEQSEVAFPSKGPEWNQWNIINVYAACSHCCSDYNAVGLHQSALGHCGKQSPPFEYCSVEAVKICQ